MIAYVDSPVYKAISFANLFGLEKGMLTVGEDGCIAVWQWKKPQKSTFNKGPRGGRGGHRGGGRGGHRGGGRGGFQGTQGKGF